jgi:Omp85 superfamily domain
MDMATTLSPHRSDRSARLRSHTLFTDTHFQPLRPCSHAARWRPQTPAEPRYPGDPRRERQHGTAVEASTTTEQARVARRRTKGNTMRLSALFRVCTSLTFLIGSATAAMAQAPAQAAAPETATRQTTIESAADEKATDLHPYEISTAEKVIRRIERRFANQTIRFHPYLQNAYRGGGFAAGAGYMFHPSPYSTLDVRGSYSIRSYKLAEAEFISPRLFDRRGELTLTGGWRDATEVAFHGFGNYTSSNDVANYGFEQPSGTALLTIRPTRRLFLVRGGFGAARWDLKSGEGSAPSVDQIYTPESLPGLGTTTTFLHTQATVGFDSRQSGGYARRGGFYGVTGHDYTDRDDALGFRQVDYEVVQHIPILRDTWVVSLHGLAKTTWNKGDQATPFYLMPSMGGGSTLRGFSSFRFSDRHSLLLQAEWRIVANRFMEGAVFYDAGKVAARTSDLDFNHLKTDYGFGIRFHAPLATVLRIDVARSNEGTRLVFAASPIF